MLMTNDADSLTHVIETGGLFRLLLRLMEAISLSTNKPNLSHLMVLLGRHFGIRDDYQNLKSKDVSDPISHH